MITIDGSQGEGGGQIVRSSLALSLVTGQGVTIHHIRAGRKKAGLRRQHLTAVRAAAEVGQARVDGDALGSSKLVFRPGRVRPGRYHFRIGTAGSATLVLQTVLVALLTADEASRITLEGGTHNPWAPPFDFLKLSYLPLLNRMGCGVDASLQRAGFFPAGGGQFTVQIEPATKLDSIQLLQRGRLLRRCVKALVARLPEEIGQRECRTIAGQTGWDDSCFEVQQIANAAGPGNVVLIQLHSEHVTEVFTGFGKRGVPAEKVAQMALDQARQYLEADVPVGPYLADQLMLPMGVAAYRHAVAGQFRTQRLTPHATTHREILQSFLGLEIGVQEGEDGNLCVTIG